MALWELTFERCHADADLSKLKAPAPPPLQQTLSWHGPEPIDPRSTTDAGNAITATAMPESEYVHDQGYAAEFRHISADAISEIGMEAVAFYAPIHFHGPAHWGIYFVEPVFFGTCANLADILGSQHWDSIVEDFLKAIDRHELFHAATELYALIVEDIIPSKTVPCHYDAYYAHGYKATYPTADCIEEIIATAIQFRCSFKTPGFANALKEITAAAPPCYNNWKTCKFPSRRQEESREPSSIDLLTGRVLTAQMRCLASRSATHRIPYGKWFPHWRPESLERRGSIPRWVYPINHMTTKRFQNGLLHGLFGNVKMRDLLVGVKNEYDAEIVSGGKHQAIKFPNGRKIPYPTSKHVPAYVIREIADAVGVDRKEVLKRCLNIQV